MKRIFFFFITGSLLLACNDSNQETSNAENQTASNPETVLNDTANFTTIQWMDSVHQSFPKIKEGQVLEVKWAFKNTGTKPLVITSATASCGCTVAERPEQPIAPGEQGIIKAKFDSHGREGEQRKDVYVIANTPGIPNHNLSFSVAVEKTSSGSEEKAK